MPQEVGERLGGRHWWFEPALMVALVTIGAALRFSHITDVPPRISADEYTTTIEIFQILHGKGPPLFGLDWKPMPAFTEHASAWLMQLVGPTILGMRLLSILLSLLAAILLYLTLRWSCSVAVAWVTALLLLSNPWFLNFSRSGWENMHPATYWLAFTWSFFCGLRSRRRSWLYYAGAGTALALSFYGYFAGRLILISWILYFPLAKVVSKRSWRDIVSAYALVSVTALVLFAPQLPVVIRRWDQFQARVRNVSIFNTDPVQRGFPTRGALAAHQLWKTARYLVAGVGIGGVHYSPSPGPPFPMTLEPFLLVGMLMALARWREGAWWWLLVGVPVLSTQALSVVGDPNLARMAPTCAGFFWFIGYGMQSLSDWLPRRLRQWLGLALVAGALVISWQQWEFFQNWMRSPGVAIARGGGVDFRDYDRWQRIQFRRIELSQAPVYVVEWDRPEVRERLLAGGSADPARP
jgi:Dolichyl-phosphate-mannose-protein mannosyltransferase